MNLLTRLRSILIQKLTIILRIEAITLCNNFLLESCSSTLALFCIMLAYFSTLNSLYINENYYLCNVINE